MKEFKGTKGEWNKVIHNIHKSINNVSVCSDNGDIICKIIKNDNNEIELANAQLIAAAPRLLESLQVCWESLKTYGDHPLIDKQVKIALDKALRKNE